LCERRHFPAQLDEVKIAIAVQPIDVVGHGVSPFLMG
jgi:hypothetical protein